VQNQTELQTQYHQVLKNFHTAILYFNEKTISDLGVSDKNEKKKIYLAAIVAINDLQKVLDSNKGEKSVRDVEEAVEGIRKYLQNQDPKQLKALEATGQAKWNPKVASILSRFLIGITLSLPILLCFLINPGVVVAASFMYAGILCLFELGSKGSIKEFYSTTKAKTSASCFRCAFFGATTEIKHKFASDAGKFSDKENNQTDEVTEGEDVPLLI